MSNSKEYICEEKKIILLWSPKVACTTLHNWFVRDICEIPGLDDPRILANKFNIIKNLNHTEIKNNFNNHKVFLFVRDPIHRCISCFINKFIFYRNEKLKNMSQLEQFSFNLIKNYDSKINDGITFNEYLNAIQHGININKINHHFTTQINVKKFLAYKNIEVNNIDNLNEKLNKINKDYGIPNKLYGKSNCSPYKKNIKFKDITNIKCFNIDMNDLTIENFKYSFDKIREIYQDDYKYFNDVI